MTHQIYPMTLCRAPTLMLGITALNEWTVHRVVGLLSPRAAALTGPCKGLNKFRVNIVLTLSTWWETESSTHDVIHDVIHDVVNRSSELQRSWVSSSVFKFSIKMRRLKLQCSAKSPFACCLNFRWLCRVLSDGAATRTCFQTRSFCHTDTAEQVWNVSSFLSFDIVIEFTDELLQELVSSARAQTTNKTLTWENDAMKPNTTQQHNKKEK